MKVDDIRVGQVIKHKEELYVVSKMRTSWKQIQLIPFSGMLQYEEIDVPFTSRTEYRECRCWMNLPNCDVCLDDYDPSELKHAVEVSGADQFELIASCLDEYLELLGVKQKHHEH